MSEFEFIKMNGLGNDFVIIDQRINELDHSSTEVQHICNRDKGIGCDQLIYIRNSEISGIPLLNFYNSDGGEISACGNGTRCVANYLMEQDNKKEIEIMTSERKIYCQAKSNSIVSVDMGKPIFSWNKIPLSEDIDHKTIEFSYNELKVCNPFFVNLGNPHAIFFLDEIKKYNISDFGPIIEHDNIFPEKINVSFAELRDRNHIILDVWERGAGRTLACGTAACATVVAGKELGLSDNNVKVSLPGGDLEIDYLDNKNIIMTGPTKLDYKDRYTI